MRSRPLIVLVAAGACGGKSVPATPDGPRPVDAAGCPTITPSPAPPAAPPFAGTAFLGAGLFTDADPTAFVDLTANGQGIRTMFDRRTNSFNEVNARLFDARFGTTVTVEIQVNPELDAVAAEQEARFYATAIGRLPAFLFADLRTVWIHRGLEPFGGGNDNLLIHTDQGATYAADGFLEEIFLHEASHTSLDAAHAASTDWLAAQVADGAFISTYAADNPAREDVAETLVPYLAQRYRADRLAPGEVDAIRAAIPNRIVYLDCEGLTLELVP